MAYELPAGVSADSSRAVFLALQNLSASFTPQGYQQISSATLAASTGLTVPAGATVAIIQNNGTQAVRFRDDGTDPTSSIGQRIPAGETLTYDGDLSAVEFIREADGAILDIAYYSR